MKSSKWNPRLRLVNTVPTLLIVHLVLRHYLASHDLVSSLFAAGAHTSRLALLLVALFMLVRLAVVLLLPVLLAWHATTWILRHGGGAYRRLRWNESRLEGKTE